VSKILPSVQKHERELVSIIVDGSAKTYVYRELGKGAKNRPWNIRTLWSELRTSRKRLSRGRRLPRRP
jgi:hypothetical protein